MKIWTCDVGHAMSKNKGVSSALLFLMEFDIITSEGAPTLIAHYASRIELKVMSNKCGGNRAKELEGSAER